jgi:uncharacterized HhH-GPD family protein
VAKPSLHLSQNPAADKLLSVSPLALLIGMVLDQQVPLEWAFAAPLMLQERLDGPLTAEHIAAMDVDSLAALFSQRPALHRYPGSMAQRVHELCRTVAGDFGGRAEKIWSGVATGEELMARIRALPGFGEQKAKIFVALLGKQLGVRPAGWEDVSRPYSEPGSFRSVADIVDEAALAKVRAFKADLKAAAKAATSGGASSGRGAPRPLRMPKEVRTAGATKVTKPTKATAAKTAKPAKPAKTAKPAAKPAGKKTARSRG